VLTEHSTFRPIRSPLHPPFTSPRSKGRERRGERRSKSGSKVRCDVGPEPWPLVSWVMVQRFSWPRGWERI